MARRVAGGAGPGRCVGAGVGEVGAFEVGPEVAGGAEEGPGGLGDI